MSDEPVKLLTVHVEIPASGIMKMVEWVDTFAPGSTMRPTDPHTGVGFEVWGVPR